MTDSSKDREVTALFLSESRATLAQSLKKIEHCVNQLSEDDLWWRPFPEANSVANVILHLCGNVGQWIVSGVGGAPDTRKRPQEFAERGPIPKQELLRRLRETVSRASDAIARCDDANLLRP